MISVICMYKLTQQFCAIANIYKTRILKEFESLWIWIFATLNNLVGVFFVYRRWFSKKQNRIQIIWIIDFYYLFMKYPMYDHFMKSEVVVKFLYVYIMFLQFCTQHLSKRFPQGWIIKQQIRGSILQLR